MVVLLPFLPVPPPASWPYLLFSSVLNGVFFIMIAEAYAHGGVALAYPLMRGVAPMITLLGAWLLLGEALPVAGWIGIATICGGVVLLARRRGDAGEATAVRFALANAVVIAAYTMNDAVGVRISQAPLAYALWLYPLSAVPTLLWLSRKTPLRWPSPREAARGLAGAAAAVSAPTRWRRGRSPRHRWHRSPPSARPAFRRRAVGAAVPRRASGPSRLGRRGRNRHRRGDPASGLVGQRDRFCHASTRRHRISNSIEAPLNAVMVPTSNGGATSTRSPPTKSRPRSARSSRSASSAVMPPASGVPVPGACDGSRLSMSKVR